MEVSLSEFFQKNKDDDFISAVRKTLFDESGCIKNEEIPYSKFYELKNNCTEKYLQVISFSHIGLISGPDSKYPDKAGVYVKILDKTYYYMFKEPIKDKLEENNLVFIKVERR